MRAKIISSLEKCFPDESVLQKESLTETSMLKNERFSFQVCYDCEETIDSKQIVYFSVESPLADALRIYKVKYIPSMMPVYRRNYDDHYLRTQPGLYPDLLEPMGERDRLPTSNVLNALWVEIDPQERYPAGIYPVTCVFTDEAGERVAEVSFAMEIIDALLPPQELIFTQWFYTDCLMQYYAVEAFEERHWQIIENFMGNAHRYGMNMILTPVLTPSLDTYVGGQRPTTQLVEIKLEDGKYFFDFTRLGRWVDLCDRVGIRYLEINHFFTQWGAAACPKVIATVNGEEKQIFGWDTPSDSEDYRDFLYALIPQMLRYLREEKNGADKRCYFHISDEPQVQDMERYCKLCAMIKPLLEGYPIMDAVSDYEFYENGATTCPVPGIDHMDAFLNREVPDLWTYYCCAQSVDVPNRFFAMPSVRNRIVGVQFYKFHIAGFLHWGFNFYNNQFSYAPINPFLCSDGECFSPSGDAFSVYPGRGGQPWPSLRQVVFYDALQDLRALTLCEQLYGRESTMALVEEGVEPISFRSYPRNDAYLIDLRQKLHAAIKAKTAPV